jgi:hypothetical protein
MNREPGQENEEQANRRADEDRSPFQPGSEHALSIESSPSEEVSGE